MFEIFYVRNNDNGAKENALRATKETYHNKESAKTIARNIRNHPVFADCTLYVYEPSNDRFYKVD